MGTPEITAASATTQALVDNEPDASHKTPINPVRTTQTMYRYYQAPDWIAHGVIVVLAIAVFLLVLREWRNANRIASEQVAAANRQTVATVQQADSTDRLAAAIQALADARIERPRRYQQPDGGS